jgi:hypothetical protein
VGAVTRPHLRLVRYIPRDNIFATRRVGPADGKDQLPVPGHVQQPENFLSFGTVRQVGHSGEPHRVVLLPGIGMIRALDTRLDAETDRSNLPKPPTKRTCRRSVLYGSSGTPAVSCR